MIFNEGLRQRVRAILVNGHTSSINFTINGARVNAAAFARVEAAVEGRMVHGVRQYRIHIIVNRGVQTNSAGAIDATYSSINNHFSFCSDNISGLGEEALVVHESVHAAFDLASAGMPAVDDEAAAYLAQCRYLIHAGVTSLPSHPIFDVVFPIAQSLTAGAAVTPANLAQLRPAIFGYSGYAWMRNRTSVRYTRNG